MSTKQFGCVKSKPVIAIGAPVEISAGEVTGDKKGPPKFSAEFYTGVAMEINGWDLPVVIDLAGLQEGNSLVANLDHDSSKRVGNFALANDGKSLVANGTASARTPARDEVVGSAEDGFQWQASLEVTPHDVEAVKKGHTAEANGRTFEGPIYVTRKGTLKGFGFVSHGADDNTSVTIAAIAATKKEHEMKAEAKAWIEAMVTGIDVSTLSADEVANIEAQYEGQNSKKAKPVKASGANPFEARKIEAARREELRDIADKLIDRRGNFITQDEIVAIEKMYDHAIEAGMAPTEFRCELYEATVPMGHTVRQPKERDANLSNRVLEAAVCQAGGLSNIEKQFTDQELQVARDKFRDGIGLNQLLILAAQANGYQGTNGGRVTTEVQNAAFGMSNSPRMHAAGGFSTISIANVVAATANKFMHEGWMAVDLTPLRIAAIRPVRNFQQITTVSLTGHLQYDKLGADGEIKHGTLADLTYTNQADTYAAMLAITRKDIINDDLGALTAAPRRLGRGGALKLNDIFWTRLLALVSESFFVSGNTNINTGVADMTIGGLAATETIFMNQTDPDGKPLGIMPKIVLVPTALKTAAIALLDTQRGSNVLITGNSTTIPNANVFQGRYQVESSPYISNSSYTGNTAVGWWMLADPNECPVIEIAALNGRVEPTVETADANFNVLGIQMRGYSDIGVKEQEKRGGVYADGGAS